MRNKKGIALLAAVIVMITVALYFLAAREGMTPEGTAIPTEQTD